MFQDPVARLSPRDPCARCWPSHSPSTREAGDRPREVARLLDIVGLPGTSWAATRTSSPAGRRGGSAWRGRSPSRLGS